MASLITSAGTSTHPGAAGPGDGNKHSDVSSNVQPNDVICILQLRPGINSAWSSSVPTEKIWYIRDNDLERSRIVESIKVKKILINNRGHDNAAC